MNRQLVIALLLLMVAAAAGCGATASGERSMETCLHAVAAGQNSEQFSVQYSDMHGLWGGVTVSVGGNVERRLSRDEIRAVAELLIELKAWKQRVPDRAPVPDESRAPIMKAKPLLDGLKQVLESTKGIEGIEWWYEE